MSAVMQSSAPEVLVFKTHAGEESPSKYFAVGTYLAAIPHLERYDATLIVPGVDFGPQLESGWREWGRHSRNVIVVGHNDAKIGRGSSLRRHCSRSTANAPGRSSPRGSPRTPPPRRPGLRSA